MCIRDRYMGLALNAEMILCIDLGTDLLASITLSYEQPECNLMERKPRKLFQHLLSQNMIIQSYLIFGIFETAAGYLGYFSQIYLYGFSGRIIYGLEKRNGYSRPKLDDVFVDDQDQNYGNTNLMADCRKDKLTELQLDD
eukprot:TRINITY_DN7430_c0_g1_i2.p2 TRINITY_DN7430_c0_g1~~TRINITY_DN7430_c0_g1_i2.p2  ORF type:complete len:140 (+),score=21.02 TRINITY_DN7430_c0_g1_i2:133-552(+)